MKLNRIEKRILEIDRIVTDKKREKEIRTPGVVQSINDARIEQANKPLLDERQQLTTEREFIIARRDNLFWRAIWNILVPVVVSILTVYLISYLNE
jgi:hypothetical protein